VPKTAMFGVSDVTEFDGTGSIDFTTANCCVNVPKTAMFGVSDVAEFDGAGTIEYHTANCCVNVHYTQACTRQTVFLIDIIYN
jgi:hypothetical protein